jgi:hypothetical protein
LTVLSAWPFLRNLPRLMAWHWIRALSRQPIPKRRVDVKVFEIEPLGLTASDIDEVTRGILAFLKREQDFVFNYRSVERRVLFLATCESGRVVDWHLMPCATDEEMPELLRWWLEQETDDIREREEEAQKSALDALASARSKGH